MRRFPPPRASRWRDAQGQRTGGQPGWAKLRKQALERDGGQCVYVNRDGIRCGVTTNLQIHHLAAGTEQVVPLAEVVTLCRTHHRSVG